MTQETVMYFAKGAILMIYQLSMPVIIAATAVGLIIALLQTLIQLQEQTLAFACKLSAVIVVLTISGSQLAGELVLYQEAILEKISLGQ